MQKEETHIPEAEYLFESSWEVCNKVGGIYTVVKSKLELTNNAYENYFLIGPLNKTKVPYELEQTIPPEWLKDIIEELKNQNISCLFGRWRTKGRAYVILIDFYSLSYKINELKKMIWEKYQIETHSSSWEFEEPMLWSYSVSCFLNLVSKKLSGKKIIGHFHEWMAGLSILFLKEFNANIATVFTTHATILGRSIAGNGMDLYNMLSDINPHEIAKKCNVLDKYTTEKACANHSNVFTTVSEITAFEAEKILEKKADVLLLNGLDIEKFPSFEESSVLHIKAREKARELISYMFFPHYNFDLTQSLFFFISGRYEFKNKGVDVYIDALSKLNEKLKNEKSKKTIIALFLIPSGVKGIKTSLLEKKEYYEQLKNTVSNIIPKINHNLLNTLMTKKEINSYNLFDIEDLDDLSIKSSLYQLGGEPEISTHQLFNEENDAILNYLKQKNLTNKKDDKVKVIFYPVYLDIHDRLFELKYYEVIQACHLGVFPSYYEPWGYTPLESAALGVPAVTTDLAGFGKFIKENTKKNEGVFVIDRLNKSYEECANQLFDVFYNYSNLSKNERVKQKMIAKKLSELADWKELVKNYYKAHNLALVRNFN
jgi:glycogen synthase